MSNSDKWPLMIQDDVKLETNEKRKMKKKNVG